MRRRRRFQPRVVGLSAFAGFRFPPEVIMLAVRWYLRFGLSYRDLEELLGERGAIWSGSGPPRGLTAYAQRQRWAKPWYQRNVPGSPTTKRD